jgi:uncharacterized protein (TIGR02996 family)
LEPGLEAIWSDPEADLPRLARADFLEAHDPIRSRFIRGQVLPDGRGNETAECFEQAGERWLAALLEPLGLDLRRLSVQHYSPSWRMSAHGHVTVRLWEEDGQNLTRLSPVCWQRGFVSVLELRPGPGMNLQRALEVEPIDQLELRWNEHLQAGLWSQLTSPATKRLRKLQVRWQSGEEPDLSSLYEDSHWSALAELQLSAWETGLLTSPMPDSVLERLGRSDWTRKIRQLSLYEASGDALTQLLTGDWPELQELEVTCFQDEAQSTELESLPPSLTHLDLWQIPLVSVDWQRLHLPHLRNLRVAGAGMNRDGLNALWQAPFLPGLERLDLTGHGLTLSDVPPEFAARTQV